MEMVITLKRLAKSICIISLVLSWGNAQAAMKLYHQTAAPATCIVGDAWIDTDGIASDRFHTCTATNTWTKNSGSFSVPVATASVSGTVKVGSRLTIADGVLSADLQSTDITGKQDILVSGTNIKTINGTTVLGSGDLTIEGGSFDITADYSPTGAWNFTGASVTGIEGSLPTLIEGQTIIGGTGGTPTAVDTDVFSWSDVSGLITGAGYIKTDGTADAGPSSMVWPSAGNFAYTVDGTTWGTMGFDTDISSTSSSDDTIPSAKAVKSAIDSVTVAAPTIQTDDPTAASADGWYAATGSGDIFYKSSAGLFTIAGVYAADPATYSLTIDMVDANGTDKITLGGTDYTTDGAITGLSGATAFTVVPDTGRTGDCVGTGITGTTPDKYADMSADRSMICTFADIALSYWLEITDNKYSTGNTHSTKATGQSFYPTSNQTLNTITVKTATTGGYYPTPIPVRVRVGTSADLSSTYLAESLTVNMTTEATEYEFTFASPVSLTANTQYYVVFSTTDGLSDRYFALATGDNTYTPSSGVGRCHLAEDNGKFIVTGSGDSYYDLYMRLK